MKRGKILAVFFFLVLLLLIPVVSVWSAAEPEVPTTTTAARTGKYGEAPMLAARVAAGELPPVEQRLPKEPFVEPVLEEIGKYGGTIRVATAWDIHRGEMQNQDTDMYVLRWSDEESKVVGGLVKEYEYSPDKKTLTFFLREGLKWSDGVPFTTDDMIFS